MAALDAATAAQPRRRVPGGRDLPAGPRRRGGGGALGPRGRGLALERAPLLQPGRGVRGRSGTPATSCPPCRRPSPPLPRSGTSGATRTASTGPSSSRRRRATCGPPRATSPTASTSRRSRWAPTAASCSTSTTSGPTSSTGGSGSRTSSRAIPLDRVREVHVAGGDSLGDVYLDSHVGPVAPEVLEIARRVLPRLPNVRAVLFEAVPHSIATLGAEGLRGVLGDLHEVVDGARAAGATLADPPRPAGPAPSDRDGAPTTAAPPVARRPCSTTRRAPSSTSRRTTPAPTPCATSPTRPGSPSSSGRTGPSSRR